MAGVRTDSGCVRALFSGAFLGAAVLLLGGSPARGQLAPGTALSSAAEEKVVQVRVVGNLQTPVEEILRQIRTRAGRRFDPEMVEEDVRRLNGTRKFVKVEPYYQQVPGGRIVIFEVYERPVIEAVRYVGNRKISKKKLAAESGIKAGDALDTFAVDEGRRRLEEFYHTKGFSQAHITVVRGNRPGDRDVVYRIDEGPKARVFWTSFVGNTIATDAKLRTKIQSKPGFLWLFRGELDRRELEEDRQRLIEYYRSLGFFRARVGHPILDSDPSRNWLVVTFVIDEGPRYTVGRVSFVGNTKFSHEELAADLKLQGGEFFNQAAMQTDEAAIADKYGAIGYYFAKVEPHMRFEEEPGRLDLVYGIEEGDRCRVGLIDVRILGEYPHTQITTVLNRLSLYPGDIVDVRELRASERRLRASGLFEVDPTAGIAPEIVVKLPELEDVETEIARQPGGPPKVRGQSPDRPRWRSVYRPEGTAPNAGDRVINLEVGGRWAAERPLRVVRGQYSAEAGHAVPPLRRPEVWPDTPPPPGGTSLPAESYLPPTAPPAGSSQAAEPLWSEAAPADPSTSPVAPPPGAPPPGPAYGNQFDPGWQLTPPVPSAPGLFSPGGPAVGDASPLLGTPPDEEPPLFVPIQPEVHETRTGRLWFSVGVNSEAGLLGSVIVDEQNFDWTRWPRSWDDIRTGTAWRGAGQRFRLEAVPGTELHKYTISFQEPYLLDSAVSLGLSGYFYNRRFREWEEQRVGGRVALGYQFTHDLSGTVAFRGAKIDIFDPILPVGMVPELDEVVGENSLYGFRAQLAHDTRDNAFLATEGHYFELAAEQVTGSFDYTRGEIDLRRYFLLRQHPDGSGRHVLSLNGRMAITGSGTPIYEHFYAGGFSTIRGFDFRGASPRDPATGVLVGGEFMLLGSIEYMFPLTADDNLRGVVFCDTGTVEPRIDRWTDEYRVAPGLGLRITIPAMGPAPIALDFAFPIARERSDEEEVFSFFIGFLR